MTCRSRAIIVHPRFAHTLPPVAAAQPSPPHAADWHSLPLELVHAIASRLDKAQDLLNLSSVCRGTRQLASSGKLWKQLCRRRFCVPEVVAAAGDPVAAAPGFWLNLYKYNHQIFMDILRSNQRADMGLDSRFGHGPMLIQLS